MKFTFQDFGLKELREQAEKFGEYRDLSSGPTNVVPLPFPCTAVEYLKAVRAILRVPEGGSLIEEAIRCRRRADHWKGAECKHEPTTVTIRTGDAVLRIHAADDGKLIVQETI